MIKNFFALLFAFCYLNLHAIQVAAPSLSSISPADGATDVALDENIVLVFDQPVFQGQTEGATFVLTNSTLSSAEQLVEVTSSEISGWGTNTITVDFDGYTFSGPYEYFVYSHSGFFENASGETYDIPYENAIFTTIESTRPTVSSYNPVNQTVQLAVDADLVLTFDEPIRGSTDGGYVRVRKYDNDDQVLGGRPAFETSLFTVSGSTLTIHLSEATSQVTTDTYYYVTIGGNAIEDLAGNFFAGFMDNSTWTFKTVDDQAPEIISRNPQHNSTFGSLGSKVNFTFDEDIVEGSGTVTLYNILNQVIETVTTGIGDSRIEVLTSSHRVHVDFDFIPEEGTQYKVGISADAFEDIYGNGMMAESHFNWAFVTNVRPHLATQSPTHEDNSVAVDASFSFSFTQDVYIESGTSLVIKELDTDTEVESFDLGSIDVGEGTGSIPEDEVLSFTPASSLDADKQYYLVIEPIAAINSELNGTYFKDLDTKGSWTFWTDLGAPTLTSFSPANDASGVPLDIGKLTMTLSEEVVEGTSGTFRLRYVGTNITVQEFDVGTSEVTISGNTVTLNDVVTLNASASYWVQNLTYENAVKDLSGKPLADWNDDTVWSFTADDGQDPTLTSAGVIDDGSYDEYKLNFTLTFSEDINVNTTSSLYKLVRGGTSTVNIGYAISEVTSNSITFSDLILNNGYDYHILIDPTAITDLSDNAYAGITDDAELAFSVNWEEPQVVSFSPANGANYVNRDSEFVVTFDRDIAFTDQSGERIKLRTYPTIATEEGFEVDSDRLSIQNGNQLVINPTNDLDFNQDYFMVISAHAIATASDPTKTYTGFNNTYTWAFTSEFNYWDGSQWVDGTPTSTDDVAFKGDYSFTEGEVLEFREIYLHSGVSLSIENNATLKHNHYLTSYGDIVIESGSALNSQGSFLGYGESSVTVKRNTTGGVSDGKYSFIGSPFASYDFTTIPGDFKYEYKELTNVYADASNVTNMTIGKGYTIANNDVLEFVGVTPATGSVISYIKNSGAQNGYNLVSNPFTAAISYDALMAAEGPTGSGDITSTIYIWDDGGSEAKSQSDFITVNTLGSVTGGSGRNSDFNGHIGVAQGFFVESTQSNTSLTFTDAMKVNGNNADANYFRTSKESYETVKIALTNSEEVRSEILVGWVSDASAAYDIKYDSRKLVGNNASQLYMPLGARNLSIQGVPLEHDEPIALAVDVKEAGNYSLSVDELSTNRALVLYDKHQDLTHNLTNSDYTFYSQQGVLTDRFELHFNAAVLSSDLLEELTIYAHGSRVNITNTSNTSKMYRMMSLSGQEVWRGEVLGHFSKDFSSTPQGVYIVTDGQQSHKIILK